MKKEEKREIILVTSNENKFKEMNSMAQNSNVSLIWFNIPKVEIQADSLEEIVKFSAIIAYNQINRPLIVEDSGLFIEALNGFPGPYSNYVRRKIGMEGIIRLLEGEKNRKAYFSTVLAYVDSTQLKLFEGRVYGSISTEIRGTKGFGYDPIFIPDGVNLTFGEMSTEEKNKYSHRAIAFRKFIEYLATYTV
ncbi:deoxyribonucleotide triphosphate pyrophosphatase [Sulfolobus acidocaldarius SUSAZ]|nr:deoxyribonucleotide triphosphate pyrophosphatase [Sulfolobus acidocaldarius SUSAZ]